MLLILIKTQCLESIPFKASSCEIQAYKPHNSTDEELTSPITYLPSAYRHFEKGKEGKTGLKASKVERGV